VRTTLPLIVLPAVLISAVELLDGNDPSKNDNAEDEAPEHPRLAARPLATSTAGTRTGAAAAEAPAAAASEAARPAANEAPAAAPTPVGRRLRLLPPRRRRRRRRCCRRCALLPPALKPPEADVRVVGSLRASTQQLSEYDLPTGRMLIWTHGLGSWRPTDP